MSVSQGGSHSSLVDVTDQLANERSGRDFRVFRLVTATLWVVEAPENDRRPGSRDPTISRRRCLLRPRGARSKAALGPRRSPPIPLAKMGLLTGYLILGHFRPFASRHSFAVCRRTRLSALSTTTVLHSSSLAFATENEGSKDEILERRDALAHRLRSIMMAEFYALFSETLHTCRVWGLMRKARSAGSRSGLLSG